MLRSGPRLLPASTPRDFLAAPEGRYVAGSTWLYACVDELLCVLVLWGAPTEDDLVAVGGLVEADLRAAPTPRLGICDGRRLSSVDPSAFAVLGARLANASEMLATKFSRVSVLRRDDFVGAVLAGLHRVLDVPFPTAFHVDPRAASAWLGHARGEAMFSELDELQARVAGEIPLLRELRALLDARPGQLTLADAARALALSERSFQRQLQASGTTFRAEMNASQVRVAKRLMMQRDATLTGVALDVGCASLQHFSELFRRVVGERPARWRARQPRA